MPNNDGGIGAEVIYHKKARPAGQGELDKAKSVLA
jgi:hypothetical protein